MQKRQTLPHDKEASFQKALKEYGDLVRRLDRKEIRFTDFSTQAEKIVANHGWELKAFIQESNTRGMESYSRTRYRG